MAVAYDTSTDGGLVNPGTSLSWSHTCTGSNGYLVVGIKRYNTDTLTVTYNSVAMTKLGEIQSGESGKYALLYGLASPATGSNTVSISWTNSAALSAGAASYTGVGSVATAGTNSGTGASSFPVSATVNVDQSWLTGVWVVNYTANTFSAGTGTTLRKHGPASLQDLWALADSNAGLGTGSQTLTCTVSGSNNWGAVAVPLEPSGAAYSPVDDWGQFGTFGI